MKYPDDANGDVPRRMEAQGDDLTRPRNVEFTVVFPNENTAKKFADRVCSRGYAARNFVFLRLSDERVFHSHGILRQPFASSSNRVPVVTCKWAERQVLLNTNR